MKNSLIIQMCLILIGSVAQAHANTSEDFNSIINESSIHQNKLSQSLQEQIKPQKIEPAARTELLIVEEEAPVKQVKVDADDILGSEVHKKVKINDQDSGEVKRLERLAEALDNT